MKRVDKKTCVITGAALGIGKACAERLADEGANIAVFDRLDDAGRAVGLVRREDTVARLMLKLAGGG